MTASPSRTPLPPSVRRFRLGVDSADDEAAGREQNSSVAGMIRSVTDGPGVVVCWNCAKASPMSVGVRVHGDEWEAEIGVYAGGWADADYARLGVDDAAISEYVELDDADAVQALLDRVIGHLSRPGANDG